MKKIKLLLIPLFSAFAMPAISQQLYIYNTGNDAPKSLFYNVRKISINAYEMGVELKNGSTNIVAFSAFDFFSFVPKHLTTFVDEIELNKIVITYNEDVEMLNIQSKNNITLLELISISGQIMTKFTPSSENFCFPVSCYPLGTYMVKIATKEKEIVQKIIKY